MSDRVMRLVMAASISPPTHKLALLALADFQNDKTGQLNPSLQEIANKVGVTRGQAQRIIRSLIDQHLLSVEANRLGGPPGTTPHYRLHLDRIAELRRTDGTSAARTESIHAAPTGGTGAAAQADATGSTDARDGQHGCGGRAAPTPQTGSTHAAQTEKEQRRNKEGTEKSARASPAQAPAAPAPSPPAARAPAKKKTATTTPTLGIPELVAGGLTEQTAADWLALRKAKRAPLTSRAWQGICRAAATAGWPVEQAVCKALTRGWAGFEAAWLRADDRPSNGADHSPATPAERPWNYDAGSIKAMGARLGVPYSEEDRCEPFPRYTAKVRRALAREQAGEARSST
jgi:hypothetical protein